jgi:hypothetical protein
MVLSATDWPTPGCLPAYKLGSDAVFLALFLLPAIKSFQPKARIACCVVLETHFLHHAMNSFFVTPFIPSPPLSCLIGRPFLKAAVPIRLSVMLVSYEILNNFRC